MPCKYEFQHIFRRKFDLLEGKQIFLKADHKKYVLAEAEM